MKKKLALGRHPATVPRLCHPAQFNQGSCIGQSYLESQSGQFHLKLQSDGNLVLYGTSALWASNTNNIHNVIMQVSQAGHSHGLCITEFL